jgi:SAM-dependent methyltransferase
MQESFYGEYSEVEIRHWWFAGRRRILIAELERNPPVGPAGTAEILDLGCGTGGMLEPLRRFGAVRGLDADERAVAFCRARGEKRVELLESDRLPLPDDSIDLVTAFDVLEHIEDDRGMVAEIGRVLRPGGSLLVTVPAYRWLWGAQDEISHHFRRYERDELRDLISESGFELRRLTSFNTLLLPAVAVIRLLRRLFPPRELRSDFQVGGGTGFTNRVLTAVFSSEAALLARIDLPAGVSLMALARTPSDGGGHAVERLSPRRR